MAHDHHDGGLCWEWDSVLLLSNPCSFNSPALEANGRHESGGALQKPVDSAPVSSSGQHSDPSHEKSPSQEASVTQTTKRDPRLDCPNFLAGRVPCACTDNDDDDTGGSRKRSKPIPRCQVAACGAELTGLKGYHQRHRVCLRCAHATRVILRDKPHRYCQQCGKFHPICDFDEGKRSCRRKLERHNNRRRRKDGEDGLQALDSGETEILNETSPGDGPSNLTTSEVLNEGDPKDWSQQEPSPDSPGISPVEKFNNIPNVSEKSPVSEDIGTDIRLHTREPSAEARVEEDLSRSYASVNSEAVVQHLEIQFGEDTTPLLAEQVSVSAESRQNIFHTIRPEGFPAHSSDGLAFGGAQTKRGNDPDFLLDLLLEENRTTDDSQQLEIESEADHHLVSNGGQHWASSTSPRKLSKQMAYSSPLPTGRISFKLYDWNPGDFPRQLRQQVMEWLSNMPVDLEGYIRSGCTILTIFIAMPQLGWDELDADWAGSVLKLVQAEQGSCRFWRSGYIIARMYDHVVHIKNGELAKPCCFEEVSVPPVLQRVHPLCIEEGVEQEVVILGQNIRQPNSRLLVSIDGKYIINDEYQCNMEGAREGEIGSVCDTNNCEDVMLSVCMPALHPMNCGTAYIEVEHMSGMSNYIPLLVAEKQIVDEVRSLEMEIDGPASCSIDENPGFPYSQRRVHNFLLDLGWILKNSSLNTLESNFHEDILELHLERLRRVLFFGVERSWCNVVRRALELASSTGFIEKIGVLKSGLSAVQVAVLHQNVAMVDHLISCAESLFASRQGIFWWNLSFPGPKGLTALHMVALQLGGQGWNYSVMKKTDSEYLWNCLEDCYGQSPENYTTRGEKLSCRIEIQNLVEMISSRFNGERNSLLPSLPHPAGKVSVWSKTQRAVAGVTKGSFSYKGLNLYINKRRKGNLNLRSSVSVLLVCAALCVMLQRPNQVILLALSLRRCLWGLETGSE